jgi:uncharacterized membrane protein
VKKIRDVVVKTISNDLKRFKGHYRNDGETDAEYLRLILDIPALCDDIKQFNQEKQAAHERQESLDRQAALEIAAAQESQVEGETQAERGYEAASERQASKERQAAQEEEAVHEEEAVQEVQTNGAGKNEVFEAMVRNIPLLRNACGRTLQLIGILALALALAFFGYWLSGEENGRGPNVDKFPAGVPKE